MCRRLADCKEAGLSDDRQVDGLLSLCVTTPPPRPPQLLRRQGREKTGKTIEKGKGEKRRAEAKSPRTCAGSCPCHIPNSSAAHRAHPSDAVCGLVVLSYFPLGPPHSIRAVKVGVTRQLQLLHLSLSLCHSHFSPPPTFAPPQHPSCAAGMMTMNMRHPASL